MGILDWLVPSISWLSQEIYRLLYAKNFTGGFFRGFLCMFIAYPFILWVGIDLHIVLIILIGAIVGELFGYFLRFLLPEPTRRNT